MIALKAFLLASWFILDSFFLIYSFSEWYLNQKNRLPKVALMTGEIGGSIYQMYTDAFFLPVRLIVTRLGGLLHLLFLLSFWAIFSLIGAEIYVAIGIELLVYLNALLLAGILKKKVEEGKIGGAYVLGYIVIFITYNFLALCLIMTPMLLN